jgi:hypothetical protein
MNTGGILSGISSKPYFVDIEYQGPRDALTMEQSAGISMTYEDIEFSAVAQSKPARPEIHPSKHSSINSQT